MELVRHVDRQRHLDRAVEKEEDPRSPRAARAAAAGRAMMRQLPVAAAGVAGGWPCGTAARRAADGWPPGSLAASTAKLAASAPMTQPGTDQRGQAAGEGRAHHDRRLRERRQDRVAVHPVLVRAASSAISVYAPALPQACSSDETASSTTYTTGFKQPGHGQDRDQAQRHRAQRGVHGDQLRAAEPAHEPGEQRPRRAGPAARTPPPPARSRRRPGRVARSAPRARPPRPCSSRRRVRRPASPAGPGEARLAQHPADRLDP